MRRLALLFILLVPSLAFGATWYTCDGSTSCTGSMTQYTYGSIEKGYSQSGDPDGNGKVIRATIPANMPDGHSVGQLYISGTMPSGTTEMWIRYYWKYSSNYEYHGVVNKQTYFSPGNTMGMGIAGSKRRVNMMPQGSVTTSYLPNIVNPATEAENFYAPKNVWYKYTAYFKLNTGTSANGIYKAWVNDVLISNYSNVVYEYNQTTFSSLRFDVIWGGSVGITAPSTDSYVYFDKIYVGSTAPSDTPGDDTVAPYLGSFSPSDGAIGVDKDTTSFSLHVYDAGDGVSSGTVSLSCGSLGGSTGITGTSADYTVTRSGFTLDYEQAVSCTVNACDTAGNCMSSFAYNWTVESDPGVPLAITTTSVDNGTVGTSYGPVTIAAEGGVSPYSYAVTSGSLPPGVSLSSAGTFSGTPTTADAYNFAVRVTDASSNTDDQDLTIVIAPNLPGGQTTTQSTDFADTYINSGSSSSNYHDNAALRVYQWPLATAANRILIMDNVDILALPDNIAVTSATLRLYMYEHEGSGGTNPMRVYVYSSSAFDTTTATWGNWDSALSAALSYADVSTTAGWKEWDVLSAVQAAYASRTPLYLALDGGQNGEADTNRAFYSVEGTYPPQMSITYTQLTESGGPSIPAPGKMRISRGQFMKMK